MKKHLISILFMALTALLALASCERQEQPASMTASGLRFTASVGEYATKATDTGFEIGDKIGISAERGAVYGENLVRNISATFDGESFVVDEGAIGWLSEEIDPDRLVTFVARYPFAKDKDPFDEQYFEVLADQSTHENYTASDLMFAETAACALDDAVHFGFVHRLSQVMVQVDNDLDSPVEEVFISGVQGRTLVRYQFYAPQAPQGETGTVKACRVEIPDADGVAREAWVAVIPPQTTHASIIVKTEDGMKYTYPMKGRQELRTGRRHCAFLELNEKTNGADVNLTVDNWTEDNQMQFGAEPLPLSQQWFIFGDIENRGWSTNQEIEMRPLTNELNRYAAVVHAANPDDESAFFWNLFYIHNQDWTYYLGAGSEREQFLYDGSKVVAANQGDYFQIKQEGNYLIILDLSTREVSISSDLSEVYSLNGNVDESLYDWYGDVWMTPETVQVGDRLFGVSFSATGTFHSPNEFKIRLGGCWAFDWGAPDSTPLVENVPMLATPQGAPNFNFVVPSSGQWTITYNAYNGTVTATPFVDDASTH